MEPKINILCSKESAIGPSILSQLNPFHAIHFGKKSFSDFRGGSVLCTSCFVVNGSMQMQAVSATKLKLSPWIRVLFEKLAEPFASQEIFRLLWNLKIHCHVQQSKTSVPILSHMNPVHSNPPYFLKMHFNIILLSVHKTSEWPMPFRFFSKNVVCIYNIRNVDGLYLHCVIRNRIPNNMYNFYKIMY